MGWRSTILYTVSVSDRWRAPAWQLRVRREAGGREDLELEAQDPDPKAVSASQVTYCTTEGTPAVAGGFSPECGATPVRDTRSERGLILLSF